ncbi:MAG: ABC transporter ATP-binding protein [Spirochaetales bacterium]|nr:ABC transporter ATP-binding protein [Spirochaetales bacterium]
MDTKIVVHVKHAYKTYDSLKAVDDLSFSVPQGQCFAFLGPNGAGKTTMMKMLYAKAERDRHPDTVVKVFGYDPVHDELAIKNVAGVVPQEDNLDVELNVVQNLKIFSKFYHMPSRYAEKRINELLDFMELSEKKKAPIRELSGGMKRRLIIARALLNEPKLLILDEPTTGLDPQVRQLIWDKIRSLQKNKVTVLLTTHYMEEAYQLAANILIIDKGKKVLEGNPQGLLEEYIESHVLEVLDKEKFTALPESLAKKVRREESGERILFYSEDPKVIHTIADKLAKGSFYIRETNLEDLFLKITGRKLHATQ